MKKFLFLAFCLMGSMCIKAVDYHVYAESQGSIPSNAKIMIMYSGDEETDSWTVKNAKTYLARSLESCGYTLTKNVNDATHVMYLSYGSSKPYDITETERRVVDKVDAQNTNANASATSYEYYDVTLTRKNFHIRLAAYSIQNGTLSKTTDYEIKVTRNSSSTNKIENVFPLLFSAAIKLDLLCKPSGGELAWYPYLLFGSDKPIIKQVKAFLENPY